MKKLKEALRKAVEMMYETEMKDTAMDHLEVKEIGESILTTTDEKQTYSWETKEQWIEERLEELLET